MATETVVALLGVSSYDPTTRADDQLCDIPQVASNVARLEAMIGAGLLGDRVVVRRLLNPQSSDEAAAFVVDAASEASGLFFCYYAGHGLRTSSGGLALTHSRSTASSGDYRALDYDKLRRACLQSPAARRIVFLDCCYSGTAIRGLLSVGDLGGQLAITQSCVIASSPSTRPSHVVSGEVCTAFTGRFLDAVMTVLEAAETATVNEVLQVTVAQLRADGLPLPEVADRNDLGGATIFRSPRLGLLGARCSGVGVAGAGQGGSPVVLPSGLLGIYRDFNDEDNRGIVTRIRRARSIFFVAHAGYNAMVSQYQAVMRNAVEGGCRLRVVVSDPNGPLMKSPELTTRLCPSIQQAEEIQWVLQACARHQRTATRSGYDAHNVQARVYLGVPSVNMLLVDRWFRMIPYLPLVDAGESPVYEFDFDQSSWLASFYNRMLDNLWSNGKAVDLGVHLPPS